MSLDPRDSQRRTRSRSPGGREPSRTRAEPERERSRVRAPSPPSSRYDENLAYGYDETMELRTRERRGGAREPDVVTAEPRDRGHGGGGSQYRSSSPAPGSRADPYAVPGAFVEREEVKVGYGGRNNGREVRETREDYYAGAGSGSRREDYGWPETERSRYRETETYKYADPRDRETDARRYEEDRHGRERSASFNARVGHSSISGGIAVGRDDHRPSYAQPPSPVSKYAAPSSPTRRPISYAEPKQWEYAQPDENITYTRRQITERAARPRSPQHQTYGRRRRGSTSDHGGDSARSSRSNVVTVDPGSRGRRDASPAPGLAPRVHSLSLSTGHHGSASLSLANAPGSPLLESYHGTYQSISPMPSPLMIASTPHSDFVEPLSPLSSDNERGKSRRTARFHDPEEEAIILAKALKGEKRAPNTAPLVEILPGLTHEQVLELRVQYKKIVKTGSDRKGVNVAKHIKMRLKEEDPSLMKACYACALGRWESEAYWANFWYQGEKSRRELLIESLMGRTNREIREIKDGFSDKKYGDSLTKCMKMELKEDKFKKAVLLVLEERKMDERPGDRIDRHLVEEDVRNLHKAVRSEKGGETAMISIVVVRGDNHLREVLRVYEATYRSNFAREMLKKSGNLVVRLFYFTFTFILSPPYPPTLLSQPLPNPHNTGRIARTHPERGNQQARPRRPPHPPRALALQVRLATHRAPHQPARALPLGPAAPGTHQEGIPRSLWYRDAGSGSGGHARRVGPLLRDVVRAAHGRRDPEGREGRGGYYLCAEIR